MEKRIMNKQEVWNLAMCEQHKLFTPYQRTHIPPCRWDWDQWFTVSSSSKSFPAHPTFFPTDALIQRMAEVEESRV